MKNKKTSEIILKNIQVKSLKKAKKLSKALKVIEEECGIHQVRVTIVDSFICPWIDLSKMNNDAMQKFTSKLLKKIQTN